MTRWLSLRCALVAPMLVALAAVLAGCTSRWAVRGDIDMTGDASMGELVEQPEPLLADPRTSDDDTDTTGGN